MPLITEQQVLLDFPAADRSEAIRALAETLVPGGRCTDLDVFLADVRKREEQMATGMPGGIGMPHARSSGIAKASLVFGRCATGIDWGAEDGPATLLFLIAVPDNDGDQHLQLLSRLARQLMRRDFRQALLDAPDAATVVGLVGHQVGDDEDDD